MLAMRELSKQLVTLSAATKLRDDHVGYFLVQWFQASTLLQNQLKVVLGKCGPHINDQPCKVAMAADAKHVFIPAPYVGPRKELPWLSELVYPYGLAYHYNARKTLMSYVTQDVFGVRKLVSSSSQPLPSRSPQSGGKENALQNACHIEGPIARSNQNGCIASTLSEPRQRNQTSSAPAAVIVCPLLEWEDCP